MRGRLPFPKWLLTVPVKVYLTELNEDGKLVPELVYEGKCSLSERGRQVLDAERRLVQLSGKVILEGDIAPGRDNIQGYVLLLGGDTKRQIFRFSRPRNPDGSVFSTELELI